MALQQKPLCIVTGNSNPRLAEEVCRQLGIKRHPTRVGRHADGEIDLQVVANARGADVFVVQSTCRGDEHCTVNDAMMELLLLIHTLRLAAAGRITAVVPHFAYARQDRRDGGRVPISASAVATMIREMGVDGVVSVQLHCRQIQGFFHVTPMADIDPTELFASFGKHRMAAALTDTIIIAPDAGAMTRAGKMREALGAKGIATIIKRRVQANKIESMQLVGDVGGHRCIIVDDMIDTAGTLCSAAALLRDNGATHVAAWATHGILTDPACARMTACEALSQVVVTDTIPQAEHARQCTKLVVLSVAPLLAEAIQRIHQHRSIETAHRAFDVMSVQQLDADRETAVPS